MAAAMIGLRPPSSPLLGDFVFDTCANGQTLKGLTVVDGWTRECLAIDVAGGIRSGRVLCAGGLLPPRYMRATEPVITREDHRPDTRADARGVSRARAASD